MFLYPLPTVIYSTVSRYILHVKIHVFVTSESTRIWIRIGLALWIWTHFRIEKKSWIRIRI
jgi:hypothetical protein